jgi:hypothetical protein
MMNQGCVPVRIVVSIVLGLLLLAGGAWPQTKDLRLTQPTAQQLRISKSCTNVVDYVDPAYGNKVRQLRRPDGHEHNMYYHRNPWNADGTYMVGIQSDLQQKNWRVVLHDGDGCFIKELFTVGKYDWRLVWDRHDPKLLYTWHGSRVYRYDVTTATAQLLKSFAPLKLTLKPNGPSLNQAGDRILVITSDTTFRSYRIADMQEERSFKVTFPPGCSSEFKGDQRYIGYKNYIVLECISQDFTQKHTYIYDDTGTLFHDFDGQVFGHTDFSPHGKWAYIKKGRGKPLEIHLINLDGTNDQVLYSVPASQAQYVRGLHISWPDRVKDWFIVSFFPFSETSTAPYASPRDEIAMIRLDGTVKYLARTGSWPGSFFWSQPLASPSSDGTRISFNSNCASEVPTLDCTDSSTGDHYILFTKSPPSSRGANSSTAGLTVSR